MPDQKVIAYFRCANPSEISVNLQKQRIQEYCKAMNYDLFSEVTSDQPCNEEQALALCNVIRKDMKIIGPLKLIVLNLHRISSDIHTVHRVADIFTAHDISLESTNKADHEVLALTEQAEYELFQALAGTGLRAQ